MYNWVLLDIELSLFHDTAPLLAVSELQCPLPGPEVLWIASNSAQWQSSFQSLYGSFANLSPHLSTSLTPSLFDLFQAFLQDNLSHLQQSNLGPQQMRLLLHPLQSLLCHLTQMLSCFTDVRGTNRAVAGIMSKASTNQRLEEVQGLLQKWYNLAEAMIKNNPTCSVTKCNLVLYHLISLNAVTNFPEIERLARKEGLEMGGPTTYWELGLRHKRCIYQREKVISHCTQAFSILRQLPDVDQPSWWSTAIYRVTLILWTDGIGRLDPNFNTMPSPPLESSQEGGSSSNAMNQGTSEDAAAMDFQWDGDAELFVPKAFLGALDNPSAVLDLGIKTVGDGTSTRIGDGIRRKLATLAANWTLDSIGTSPNVGT